MKLNGKNSGTARKKIFLSEGIRTTLPKPKMPRTVFWKVHENKSLRTD